MNRGTITKLYSRGEIEDPILARLFFQTSQLLEACLTAPPKETILSICIKELVPTLIHCAKLSQEINVAIDEEYKSYKPPEGTLAHMLPSVSELEQKVSNFLYQAKVFIRECTKIYNAFNGTTFTQASDFYTVGKNKSKIILDAQKRFGEDHPIYLMLKECESFLEEIGTKRNAREHPGERSGNLNINNFRLADNNGTIILILPTWQHIDKKEELLGHALKDITESLMLFAEDLIAFHIRNLIPSGLDIAEIPVEQRDKDIPVRLTYIFKLPPATLLPRDN